MKDQIIVFRLLPQECQMCHRLIRNMQISQQWVAIKASKSVASNLCNVQIRSIQYS